MKKNVLLILLFFLFKLAAVAQDGKNQLEKLIDAELTKGVPVNTQTGFVAYTPDEPQKQQIKKTVSSFSVLKINKGVLKRIQSNTDDLIEIPVTLDNGQTVHLLLKPVNIFSDDFKAMTDKGPVAFNRGGHFRGIVKEWKKSLAALSVFDNEANGFFASADKYYSINKTADIKSEGEVFALVYDTRNLLVKETRGCATEAGKSDKPAGFNEGTGSTSLLTNKVVRISYEANYATYSNFPSRDSLFNKIATLANEVGTNFLNDEIRTCVSSIFVWTCQDPILDYSSTGANSTLYALNAYRRTTGINGDIGVYYSTHFGPGGIAIWNGANSVFGFRMCAVRFEMTSDFFTVYRTMHEIGHMLGSHHSNSCLWAGGPIESCGPYLVGNNEPATCSFGANYTGDTATAYTGIKSWMNPFEICAPGATGYGTFIRDYLKAQIDGTSYFGTVCGSTPAGCLEPKKLSVTHHSTTGVSFNWTSVAGAANYTLEYYPAGQPAVTINNIPATTPTVSFPLNTGLGANTEYYWRVKANCSSGGSSPYNYGPMFSLSNNSCGGAGSIQPTVTNISSSGVTINWTGNASQAHYISYKKTNELEWTPVFSNLNYTYLFNNSVNLTCLDACQTYDYRIMTGFPCNTDYFYSQFTTATNTSCGTPPNMGTINIAQTSATLNWGSVSGADPYFIEVAANSNFINPIVSQNVTTNQFTVTGLTPLTQYFWRIRSNCGASNSCFGSASFTTLQIIPVTLTGFTATSECPNEQRVRLNWSTQTENNSSHFVIERSTDGSNYMWVTKVAAAGNSSTPSSYLYYDNYPVNGFATYRLVMVDLNGDHVISPVAAIQANAATCFSGVQPPAVNCSAVLAGADRLCYNNSSYTYSLSNIPDYTYINWSVTPAAQSLVSSATHYTNKFELVRNGGDGTVNVSATLSRCTNSTVTKPVAVGALPMPGVSIAGNGLFCSSSQFSILNLPPGSTVLWTSSNTSIATISTTGLASGVSNGTCTIKATITAPAYTCYGVTTLTRSITVGNPASITIEIQPANTNLCSGTPFMAETYLEGATSYTWQAPSGLQFNSPNGLSYIHAQVANPPLGGPLTVTATNQCGSVTASHVVVPQPEFPYPGKNKPYITLPEASCITNTFIAQVVAVPDAVSYSWRVRELDANGNILVISPWIQTSTNQASYNLTNILTRSAVVYVFAETNCGRTITISATFNTCRTRGRAMPGEEFITVQPNPTTGICRVNVPREFLLNSTYVLSTLSGEQLLTGKVVPVKSYFMLNLSGYASGMYKLMIRNEKKAKQVFIIRE